MTAEAFNRWLVYVTERGIISSAADAGRKLGVTPNTILNYKRRGCDLKTALACAALAMRTMPWH